MCREPHSDVCTTSRVTKMNWMQRYTNFNVTKFVYRVPTEEERVLCKGFLLI